MEIVKGAIVTSKYGIAREFYIDKVKMNDVHTGLDIVGKSDDLLAIADGKVLYSTLDDGTGSRTIITAHGGVLGSGIVLLVLYAHCSAFSKKVGDKVKKGEKVATMGMTGNAVGKHLHVSMYAIPPKTWHEKNGNWYKWSYDTRDLYEIDPNTVLKLY